MFGDAGDAEARILRRDIPDVTLVQQAPAVTATPADGAPADTIWTFKETEVNRYGRSVAGRTAVAPLSPTLNITLPF